MNQTVRNEIVSGDIDRVCENKFIDWHELAGKTVLVTGVTGYIGSFLVRCLLRASAKYSLGMHVVASGRSHKKIEDILREEAEEYGTSLSIYEADINEELDYEGKIDYLIHAASPTASQFFVERPEETRHTIVNGTRNVLNLALNKRVSGMVYLSSVEALGDIKENTLLSEDAAGEIDERKPRNSYNIGKREAEQLCSAYAHTHGLCVITARLAQVIGSNVAYDDWHVYAEFARSIVEKRDIVLKTTGESVRSACYVTDAINAILLLLLKGNAGEVYHVANESAAGRIVDVACMLTARYTDSHLRWDIKETTFYPDTTFWNMSAAKIRHLGWQPAVSLEEAYTRLISSFSLQRTQ